MAASGRAPACRKRACTHMMRSPLLGSEISRLMARRAGSASLLSGTCVCSAEYAASRRDARRAFRRRVMGSGGETRNHAIDCRNIVLVSFEMAAVFPFELRTLEEEPARERSYRCRKPAHIRSRSGRVRAPDRSLTGRRRDTALELDAENLEDPRDHAVIETCVTACRCDGARRAGDDHAA